MGLGIGQSVCYMGWYLYIEDAKHAHRSVDLQSDLKMLLNLLLLYGGHNYIIYEKNHKFDDNR